MKDEQYQILKGFYKPDTNISYHQGKKKTVGIYIELLHLQKSAERVGLKDIVHKENLPLAEVG